MTVRTAVLVASLLCFAPPSPAGEDGWHVDGKLVPDEPWRAHDGPFLALLMITEDADALYKLWNKKPGNVPMKPTASASGGTHVEAVVVFARCQPNEQGNCSVWGTATVETSDGRVLVSGMEIPLWVDRPPLPGAALGISEHGVGLVVEDFQGSYKFRMVVHDRVAARKVTLTQDLAVRRQE